jgi:flavin-dependent dehydrogenase
MEQKDIKQYDVLVVGGGVAGSIAAKFAAKQGLKTLLIEKAKTPRNKPCSGIQFSYFEKLIGEKIPREVLCQNSLFKVEMMTPRGRVIRGQMSMLNFWRSTFDSWLNSLATKAEAEFWDGVRLVEFQEDSRVIKAKLASRNSCFEVKARYLIAADGLLSGIRKKLRPEDFNVKATGGAINFYFSGETNLDPNTLYMFYQREFSNLMFAWVYLKDAQWVIGSGADPEPLEYAKRFFNYIEQRFSLRGEVVRREGFASPLKSGVFPGVGNILITGDAAGLVDLYRGVGMDNAAISGRLAIKAILKSEETGRPPCEAYSRLLKGMIRKIDSNAARQKDIFATNESLEKNLSPARLLRGGILMLAATQLNRILPPERAITLPL